MADKVKKDNEILNGRLWDHSDNSLQEIILFLKKTLKNNDTIFSQSSLLLKEKKKKSSIVVTFLKKRVYKLPRTITVNIFNNENLS